MKRQNKKTMVTIIIWIVTIVILLIVYGHFDPVHSPFALRCPLKSFTGWSCPFCGVQRAAHALLNGNVLEAVKYNYLIVPAAIYIVVAVMAYYELLLSPSNAKRLRNALSSNIANAIILVVLIAWGIVRNLPYFATFL